jgi:hypothetical protein
MKISKLIKQIKRYISITKKSYTYITVHFMTKNTVTKSGAWPYHDKAHCYYIWSLTISWQNTLLLWHGVSMFCHEMVKFQAYYQSVFSWNGQVPDIVSVCFVMKRASPGHTISRFCHYYVWGLTIAWQNTLLLCLGLDHFMTKQTDTLSGTWPFHDKEHCY